MKFRLTKKTEIVPSLRNGNEYGMYLVFLFLPVLNSLADSTIYYFIDAYGTGLHLGLIRGAILSLFILAFAPGRILRVAPNYLILIFMGYAFLLSLLSSNVNHSLLDGYFKWFVAMMLFPVGYWLSRDYDTILRFNYILVFSAFIICLNLLIAQFTGYGMSAYGGEAFYTGGAGVGITNQLALILITYPVLIRNFSRFNVFEKWFISIVGIFSFVFLLLAMKRAGIIALGGGSLVFILFTRSRARILNYLLPAALVVTLTFPIYSDMLLKRYEARVDTIEQYESEARYQETFYVLREFKEGNMWHKLFGSEAFNTGQFFGRKYFNRPRMIHGDFSALLYGTGILGLGIYFLIFFSLFRRGASALRVTRNNKQERELLAVFFGLLFATFLISATGSGTVGERCLVYSWFGIALGYLNGIKRDHEASKHATKGNTEIVNGNIFY